MNLGYGVIGSAIKFSGNRYKRWDGSAEYFHLLYALSRRSNINKIYLLSRNDFLTLPEEERKYLDPYNKVIDCFTLFDLKDYKKFLKKSYKDDDERLDSEYKYTFFLADTLKDIKIDRCLLYASQGMRSPIAIPGQLRIKRDPKTRGKVLAMSMNYSSPILNYLNNSNAPWDLIGTDPRYVEENMYPRGLINTPQNIFSQKTFKAKWETLNSYTSYDLYDESYKEFTVHYAEVEKVNTFGESVVDLPKETEMIILANNLLGPDGALKTNKRFLSIKEYILDKDINCNIYGKWPDEVLNQYNQFKGFLEGDQVNEILKRTKYTLLFPLLKGWASGKFGEVLLCGVIPFIHPEYDTQKNILPDVPFIRVSSPEDLKRKIDFLNKNENERISLHQKLVNKYITNSQESVFNKFNSIIGREVY